MGAGVLSPLLSESGLTRDATGALAMGEVPLEEIARAVGTPTYVYDAAVVRERYRRLDAAFGDLPHHICYAVKANGNLAVLRLLAELGAGADIVSGGELMRAIAAGFSPDRIVFSGVGKTDEELQAAIHAGVGHINVESLAELRRLAMLADLQGATVSVGIRVNPDVTAETHPYISTGHGGIKFGVPIDQLEAAFAVIEESGSLRLDALAMHLGSQILKPTPWVDGLAKLATLLGQARARGHLVPVLDIGGGLGIRYRDEEPLTPDAWIGALRDGLRATGCTIQVEPGRYLVGPAGVLLTRVVHRKHSGGRDIAQIDREFVQPSAVGRRKATVYLLVGSHQKGDRCGQRRKFLALHRI